MNNSFSVRKEVLRIITKITGTGGLVNTYKSHCEKTSRLANIVALYDIA